MAITPIDWVYSEQQRRFLEQLGRAFSGYQYKPGLKNGVQQPLRLVPCRMAATNRMVGHILRNLSENTALTVPMITFYQTGLKGRREDVQALSHVESLQVSERAIDSNGPTPVYTGAKGNSYTVERLMPKPFEMSIQVDVWTSNLDQKYQLEEQILTIIYPSFDIQNSENSLDWTALTTVYVEDIIHSSRSIPIGADSEIDIMTIQLRLPMWISPPAKIRKQKVIQQIVANIYDVDQTVEGLSTGEPTQKIITPGDCHVLVDGESILLLNNSAGEFDQNGKPLDWGSLFQQYGTFSPVQSHIWLMTTDDINGPFISGTLQYDRTAPNKLIWQIDIDTLPGNTLPPITAVIDPHKTSPGNGLPAAVNGVRYLLLSNIGASYAWPGIVAAIENDIIEFKSGVWTVSFNSRAIETQQYVLNTHTSRQLRWTGKEWAMGIDGTYAPGFWRLVL